MFIEWCDSFFISHLPKSFFKKSHSRVSKEKLRCSQSLRQEIQALLGISVYLMRHKSPRCSHAGMHSTIHHLTVC